MRFDFLPAALRDPRHCFHLDLAGQGLEVLPEEMADLHNLETLDLRRNPALDLAVSLPRLAELKGLKKLILMDCALSSLPESIGSLRSLQHLYLDDNCLTALPESLARLQGLTNFSADGNAFEEFPTVLCKLSDLKFLSLNKNKLTDLPPEIGQMSRLIQFNVKENRFSSTVKAALPQRVPRSVFIFGL